MGDKGSLYGISSLYGEVSLYSEDFWPFSSRPYSEDLKLYHMEYSL